MSTRFTISRAAVGIGALAVVAFCWGGFRSAHSQSRAVYRAARNADGQPDLSGIWQTMNTANWDIEEHGAAPAPYADLVGA